MPAAPAFRRWSSALGLIVLAGCGAEPAGRRATAPGIVADAPDPAPPARADGRLPGGVVPTGYDLELTVDPTASQFFGRARIGVRIEQPTRAIVLHGRGLTLQTAAVETSTGKLWAKARLRPAAASRGDPEELVLVLERAAKAGDAVIDIQYSARFAEGLRGLYRVSEASRWYAFTQFEPNDARRAFPCFDEPGFKVPVRLRLTVPEGNLAIANMPLAETHEQPKAGLVTYAFETSPPLPTYLVAFAVGSLELAEGSALPTRIRVASVAGKTVFSSLALQAAAAELALLSDYFGEPYPYAKLDLVAVPNFAAGAMENPGLVTFREELLLLDPTQASQHARRSLAGILAHELAHMWFGNLVTMSWWDDLWLNEALATWMAAKIVDRFRPEYSAGSEAVARKLEIMNVDALVSARKVRQPVRSTSEALEAFDGITYVKGMGVLAMLESWIGRDAFQRGMKSYVAQHRWKNATAADLTSALAQASGLDVAPVLDSFIDQSGVPLVDVALDCGGAKPGAVAKPTLRLTQQAYRPLGSAARDTRIWRFPACVRFEASKGRGRACAFVDAKSVELPLDVDRCPRWIVANADEAGYFRWRLPRERAIALASQAQRLLNERERLGLVAGSWALVRNGDWDTAAFLQVLKHFRNETSRVVWEQIGEALAQIDRGLIEEPARPAFRRFVAELAGPSLRRLGADAKRRAPPDAALLHKTLLRTLGDLAGDAGALEQAAAHAERWLAEPASVDADLAAVALALRARRGDAALFERILAAFRAASTPERRLIALGGLTGFDDPRLVERTLGMVVDGTIKTQDVRYVFLPLFERRASRPVAYRWLETHIAELERVVPSFVFGRLVWIMAQLCDRERIAQARALFAPRVANIEGADKHLSQALETGELCAALGAAQASKLTQFLSHGGKG